MVLKTESVDSKQRKMREFAVQKGKNGGGKTAGGDGPSLGTGNTEFFGKKKRRGKLCEWGGEGPA